MGLAQLIYLLSILRVLRDTFGAQSNPESRWSDGINNVENPNET